MMKQSWTFSNRIELFLYSEVAATARHDLLKQHLAKALNKPSCEIELERRRDGKWLLRTPDRISFSTSHSKDRLLIAIDPDGRPLGVDLQILEPSIDLDLLARHLYSQSEQEELKRLPAEKRASQALRLWCLKEARFKTYGDSTFQHPNEIAIAEELGDGFYYAACSF